MREPILVLNAGSSSIKFSLFNASDGETPIALSLKGEFDGIGSEESRFWVENSSGEKILEQEIEEREENIDHQFALRTLLDWIKDRLGETPLLALGHRVVHGGTRYSEPVIVDDEVIDHLQKLIPLAPLHQPHNLAGMLAVRELDPALPQVACFDTAFHRTQPRIAELFALPYRLSEEGIKRYGFHGLSYEYIAKALPRYLGETSRGRVVAAHLGNGISMCAMKDRRSVATTMGFTALDGLPMGTRCGNIDPGVLLYLLQEKGMDAEELTRLLYYRSGMLGVSGISNDMRELEESEEARARLAIELLAYRITRELGSLAAALGGLDALVFTAGIGENSSLVREKVCRASGWLGIELDRESNRRGQSRISAAGSAVGVYVIPTNEELMIAEHTYRLVHGEEKPEKGDKG